MSTSNGTYTSNFIDDACNRDGYVAASPGLHGPLSFEFRPALPAERAEFLRVSDPTGKSQIERTARVLDKHVISWDAKNGRGEDVSKSAEMIAKLHPKLLTAVLDQVMGYSAAEARADAGN